MAEQPKPPEGDAKKTGSEATPPTRKGPAPKPVDLWESFMKILRPDRKP